MARFVHLVIPVITKYPFSCRAFNHIFETISVLDNVRCLVHASYLEIYNEEIRDLLGKNVKDKMELKEHPDKGVYVQGKFTPLCHIFYSLRKMLNQIFLSVKE